MKRTLVVRLGWDLGTAGALGQFGLGDAAFEASPAVKRRGGNTAETEDDEEKQDGEEGGGRAPRHGG